MFAPHARAVACLTCVDGQDAIVLTLVLGLVTLPASTQSVIVNTAVSTQNRNTTLVVQKQVQDGFECVRHTC